MKFSAETKVNEIALAHPAARRILEDAGVDYCCADGKSLHEACLHADVPVEEILNQLRQNSEFVDPEQSEWISRPLAELTRHIRQHHHQYVRDASAINDPPQFSSAERKAQKIVCRVSLPRDIRASPRSSNTQSLAQPVGPDERLAKHRENRRREGHLHKARGKFPAP